MNLNNIILEEIDNFLNENLILISERKHKSKKRKKRKEKGKGKTKNGRKKNKSKKLKGGLRTSFDYEIDKITNPNLNNQDAEELNNLVDSDVINTAAVAHKVYPHHTRQGAQSQLRKKIKGLRSDSGSKYRLKKKEAYRLRRALSRELHK